MFIHGQTSPPAALSQPWRLPPRGLAVFHGEHNAPRLSHYFMPRLALEGKRILFLDGANCADPRLMARLAERRGIPFAQFNQQIMLARAFTCFQLTELISRVPQFLAQFPAQVLMVTAFPELYFDEDVRQADANAAFQQALGHLRHCASQTQENRRAALCAIRSPRLACAEHSSVPPTLTVALFSSASGFQPPAGRKRFFAQTCAAATELWKFQVDGQGRLRLAQQTEGSVDLDLLPPPPTGRVPYLLLDTRGAGGGDAKSSPVGADYLSPGQRPIGAKIRNAFFGNPS